MPWIRKLHRMDQLRDSGFGRPPPRHGLNLLHWFASECIYFTGRDQIVRRCDPWSSEYGFHLYKNKPDNNGVRLLPESNLPYYSVGNLNHQGAFQLPRYVRERHTGFWDNSNTDRIIVDESFRQVYITQHSDCRNFDPDTTYRISWSLLRKIRQRRRVDFLWDMGHTQEDEDDEYYDSESDNLLGGNAGKECQVQMDPNPPRPYPQRQRASRDKSCCDCCTIL